MSTVNARKAQKFENAVKRGAAFLDERRPSWFTKINTKKLALEECDLCILGQLYATNDDADGYERGLELLNGVVAKNPTKYGFNLDSADSFDDVYWHRLTVLWNAEVAARRAARRASAA